MSHIEIKGLDEIQRNLERLRRNAEAIDGTEVPLTELMPDEFIRQNTNFQTLQEMCDTGGIEKAEDFHGEAWSTFVAANTQFGSWEDMTRAAGAEWVNKKLNA